MNKSRKDKIDKIIKMSDMWMRYVGTDHHKDCDCHWYIQQDFAYGDKPVWSAYHYGYIFEGKEIHTSSYDGALNALIELLKEAFITEIKWASEVNADVSGWDDDQVERAKYCRDVFLKYLK